MWKILLLVLALTGMVAPARAIDYTDLWWIPTESGWGVNFVQSDGYIFATAFIYAADGTPTWISAEMERAVDGSFSGPAYANTGPYYGAAAYAQANVTSTRVGTASFTPLAPAYGVFAYNVFNVAVSKNIQRESLIPSPLDGAYIGGLTETRTGCDLAARNGISHWYAEIHVDQNASGLIQLAVPVENSVYCTIVGTVEQTGRISHVDAAHYVCDDGLDTTANLSELKSTSIGIEGRWLARDATGCLQDVSFSAVRK